MNGCLHDMRRCAYLFYITFSSVTIFLSSTNGSKEVCRTPGCLHTAQVIIDSMDPGVDPCQDFYRFACGGFLNKTRIPEERHMWTVTSQLELSVLRRIAAEFNASEEPGGDDRRPRHWRLARDFYTSCMDTERLEEEDVGPMRARLERLGGWPVLDEFGIWDEDEFDWVAATGALAADGWATDMLVDVCIGADAANSSRFRLELFQADLGIPREYLVNGLTDPIVQTYFEMMVEVAEQFGAPLKWASEELSDVLMFEIELAKISVPIEQMRDHFKMHNPMSLSEMEEVMPSVKWSQLMQEVVQGHCAIGPQEKVDVLVPEYFKSLGPLLDRVDKRVVANYMLWHVVYESLPFLPRRVAQLRRKLMIALTGASKFKPRWEFCLTHLVDRFEHAVGAAYVRKYFRTVTKTKATEMVQSILKEFQLVVGNVSWMCHETRLAACKKAASIFYHVGYPDELQDDNELDKYYERMNATGGNFLDRVLSAQRFEGYRAFSQLHVPVNKTRWDLHCEVTEVNAFYISEHNAIEIPAGILQDIFFDDNRPNYLNFGALGSVIGHELIHSVDDEGKQYDFNGNLLNWWDWETHKEFIERASDIVREYSSYTVQEINKTLNGVNIQGEVIADHGGYNVAHRAYRRWAGTRSEPRLPRLEQYSALQMFWLSGANSWCTAERAESMRLGVAVDAHPPAEFRVNGPLRHSHHFADDWTCPRGTYMNPHTKYNVW